MGSAQVAQSEWGRPERGRPEQTNIPAGWVTGPMVPGNLPFLGGAHASLFSHSRTVPTMPCMRKTQRALEVETSAEVRTGHSLELGVVTNPVL